jgi:hypothetical protein
MILQIKRSTYAKLLEWLDSSSPKKIAAIKAVRSETKCGLREAKDAVELLMYEKGLSQHQVVTEHRIHVGPIIKRMVVDYGSGEIEVDLESMEMRALMELGTIGLDACGEVLDLVKALKAFQDGKAIGVIGEDQ